MTEIDTYAGKIPKALRLALNGIAGDEEIGYAIVMLLIENPHLTENEIIDSLTESDDTNPTERSREITAEIKTRLDDLQTGGIIQRHPGERIGDPDTGTYTVTNFGKAILDGLHDATSPREYHRKPHREEIDQRFMQSVASESTNTRTE